MEDPFKMLFNWVASSTGLIIVAIIATGFVILFLTFLITKLIVKCLRKFLTRDSVPLPSTTIYVNITRVACWGVGISVFLSTCFNINISGIIAALGVGGIAISLGFKDTISNLISGVQITGMKIMTPGDHIMIENLTGTVKDTTWRHTQIIDMYGQTIIVPNSVINSKAIVKKRPFNYIRVHIELHAKNADLDEVTAPIIDEVRQAIKPYGALEDDVKILFTSIADKGAKGSLIVKMLNEIDGYSAVKIKDTIVKTIAPYVEAAKEDKTIAEQPENLK